MKKQTEETFQNEFETKLTEEFEGLVDQIFYLKMRAEAYCKQEEPSEYFLRTLQCIQWVCDNYAFAPYEKNRGPRRSP